MADLPVGSGGRSREKSIDKNVSDAVNGDKRHPAARTGDDGAAASQKPRYVPTEREKKTRQYGSPIDPPIFKKGSF